jgi:hypothetical protein
MTTDAGNVHPDEGTLHAWLDNALSAAEAERIAEHVATCAMCEAVVAEARGLIAGASRIVSMLDDRPTPVVRLETPPVSIPPSSDRSLWRTLRVTPARAAIAATLIVALGVMFTRNRVAIEDGTTPHESSRVAAAPATPDSVLTSAIVEKLKREQPVPVVGPATKPGVAVDAPASPPPLDAIASRRVSAARKSLEAQRDTTIAADRARVGFAPPAAAGNASTMQQLGVAAKAAESAGAAAKDSRADVATMAGACLRVETTDSREASWGPVSLPVILAFDSAGRMARVLEGNGKATDGFTVARSATSDSLVLGLRRIGYTGTMELGAGTDARVGTLRSSVSTVRLEENVVTASDVESRSTRARRDTVIPKPAPAAAAPAARTFAPASAAGVQVSARRVACPIR